MHQMRRLLPLPLPDLVTAAVRVLDVDLTLLADDPGSRVLADLEAQDPSLALPPDTANTVLIVAMVMSLVFALLIAGAVLLVVRKMRAGKLWARAVLTVIGVVIVVGVGEIGVEGGRDAAVGAHELVL